MARPLRIEYDGALYHITSRGNERNLIYREEEDYNKFLEILSELPQRYSILIHGYVLMGNHYHLLIETPKANITTVMHYLNTKYTVYFNRKYKRDGHLFQGRYKGILIDKERYLLSVSRYIHLNPVRAKFVDRPEKYKWSSYPAYIEDIKSKKWLTCDWVLRQYSEDLAEARKLYKSFVDQGLNSVENPFNSLKGGFILGNEDFINVIKKKLKLKSHREIPESRKLIKDITYKEVISIVSKRLEVSEQDIRKPGRRDNKARQICLYLLKKYTDMSNEDIGKYFAVGYTAVSQAVLRLKREMEKDKRIKKIVWEVERDLLSEE